MTSDKPYGVASQEIVAARGIMTRRRKALRDLAQIELAEQIMREDEKIRRDLSN
jgi:hypothetical protein